MADRCEPPPERREADGWHWLCLGEGRPEPVWWIAPPGGQGDGMWRWINRYPCRPAAAAAAGWVYRGPVVYWEDA